jgi:hypothetical protein
MPADYRNFKTPYFEIEIGDSTGQRLVKLPHHILRLVEKVEILETFDPPGVNTIKLTFIEGSREPASPDQQLGTDGLYKIPNSEGGSPKTDISGSITNRSGTITDLRFSGSSGITFLTEQEQRTGRVDNSVQENIIGQNVTRKHVKEPTAPLFLFQERNQVRVTWGYKEDPSSVRSIRAYILHLSTTFPENGPTRTVVTCEDTGRVLDQVAPVKGVPFGRRVTSPKGNSVITFEDLETDTLIRNICDKAGLPCIVSTDLPAPKMDADKQKVWIAGESFHQFMTRLADAHGCYYKVTPDPENGRDTIIFIKKADFEGKVIIGDKTLTTYKGPGTLLRTVDIKIDFAGLAGNARTGVNKEGSRTSSNNGDGQDLEVLYTNEGQPEQHIPMSPVGQGNEVGAAKGIVDTVLEGESTGVTDVHPTESSGTLDARSKLGAKEQERKILLEFTTLGYTRFTPGVVDFRNIGVRYSGKYRLITVTHTIDSSGYSTKGTGISFALRAGGVPNPEAQKGQDAEEGKEEVVLYTNESNGNTVRDQYDKFNGTR